MDLGPWPALFLERTKGLRSLVALGTVGGNESMTVCQTLFAALVLLASIDSTVQNQAWREPFVDDLSVQSIIGRLDPRRRDSAAASMLAAPSPMHSASSPLSSPLAWDPAPLGDHVFRSALGSPVTDSDSDVPRTSSGAWGGVAASGADDWQLPPALGAMEEDGSVPMMEPVTEESAGSLEDGGGLRRRCHLCKLMDATRGVAEASDSGRWLTLVCRHCSQFIKRTIALSTRCHGCRRYANFGPVGGTRRDALHCKRHRQPYEINVARKRCEYGSELPGLLRHGMCTDVPVVSISGSRYCTWHGQHAARLGGGVNGDSGADITLLPSAGRNTERQCIREGCTLTASFGDSSTGAIVCSIHRQRHHVDMIHKKRCEHGSCDRNPAYGLPSEGIARFCKEHRPGSYIDLRSRKCQHPYGCGKRPSFGDDSDGIARFCMRHKLAHHINVKSRLRPMIAQRPHMRVPTSARATCLASHARSVCTRENVSPHPFASTKVRNRATQPVPLTRIASQRLAVAVVSAERLAIRHR